jgi:hypothetical protein
MLPLQAFRKPIAVLAWCCQTALIAAPFLALCGCSEANPLGRRAITGTVNYQGQPLEYGAIRFEPTGKANTVEGGAVITQGKYQIPEDLGLPPGTYKVWIISPESGALASVEEAPGETPRVPAGRDRIPAQYNVETTLVAEVTATGKAEFNFDLK